MDGGVTPVDSRDSALPGALGDMAQRTPQGVSISSSPSLIAAGSWGNELLGVSALQVA